MNLQTMTYGPADDVAFSLDTAPFIDLPPREKIDWLAGALMNAMRRIDFLEKNAHSHAEGK